MLREKSISGLFVFQPHADYTFLLSKVALSLRSPYQKYGARMTILIADDSAGFRLIIKNLVKRNKNIHSLVECENGLQTMHLIHETRPDIIILDICMPIMSGIQVLKEIKEQGMEMIIFIVSNYPYPQFKKKCMALGADFYFNKSDDYGKMCIAIQNLKITAQN